MLNKLQENFVNYVVHGDASIADQIVSTEILSAHDRLNIYGDAYYLRLVEALGLDYPKLRKLLGIDRFEKICRRYIDRYPPNNFLLRHYGQTLAEFIAQIEPLRPLWHEFAQFEWALRNVLDTKDAITLTVANMTAIPAEKWGELIFTWHPSVVRIYLQRDVPALWLALEHNQPRTKEKISTTPRPWLAWRHQQRACFALLTPEQNFIFEAIEKKQTFADLCEGLCEWHDEEAAAELAAGILFSWINSGMLCKGA